MRKTISLLTLILLQVILVQAQVPGSTATQQVNKTIFVAGGGLNKTYIKYVASLTNKPNPKICFIPTATGDSPTAILNWYANCEGLELRPFVMRTFINSARTKESFEEVILSMDAIIVGGGNTLNMIAIWKAQGIDLALKKAYDSGIILAGGSAGSLCWFTAGSTDSRPKELTIVEGLNFLNYSHSPHYLREEDRRPLYHQLILSGKLKAGYACDDLAGLLFVNGEFKKSVSQDAVNKNYFVSMKDGKIIEGLLPTEIIN
jgi:peptidase E